MRRCVPGAVGEPSLMGAPTLRRYLSLRPQLTKLSSNGRSGTGDRRHPSHLGLLSSREVRVEFRSELLHTRGRIDAAGEDACVGAPGVGLHLH